MMTLKERRAEEDLSVPATDAASSTSGLHRRRPPDLSDPFHTHSNLSKMQSFSYREHSLPLR